MDGVAALLETGLSDGVSFCADMNFGRPRNERNDLLEVGSSDGTGGAASSEDFGFGCSCSLNCAGSGWDWEGVSETATSPTCFCGPSLPLSTLGLSRYQKAQPDDLGAFWERESLAMVAGGGSFAASNSSGGSAAGAGFDCGSGFDAAVSLVGAGAGAGGGLGAFCVLLQDQNQDPLEAVFAVASSA